MSRTLGCPSRYQIPKMEPQRWNLLEMITSSYVARFPFTMKDGQAGSHQSEGPQGPCPLSGSRQSQRRR